MLPKPLITQLCLAQAKLLFKVLLQNTRQKVCKLTLKMKCKVRKQPLKMPMLVPLLVLLQEVSLAGVCMVLAKLLN